MQKLVGLALRFRSVVLVLGVALVVAGLLAFRQLPIEAYPNPVPPLVEVIAQPPGWSAEESERYVTIPLEIGLSGMPRLDHIRSQSLFGLVDVKCYFKWGIDYEDARQEVINRLQFIQLPQRVQAQISPWNAIGEVFRYQLVGKGYTLQRAEDAPRTGCSSGSGEQVPGVIDVTSFGGDDQAVPRRGRSDRLRGARRDAAPADDGASRTRTRTSAASASRSASRSFTVARASALDPRRLQETSATSCCLRAEWRAGARPRRRDVLVGWRAAARHRRQGRRCRDIVQGIVLDAVRRQTRRTLDGVQDRLDYIRKYHLLAAGHGHRAVLRPRRAGRRSPRTPSWRTCSSAWCS